MSTFSATETTAPHALLLPYPAQGHVIPFMELAHRLVNSGFAVTFVNTEFNHRRVVDAAGAGASGCPRLRLVGVADGMGYGGDRDNFVRLNAAMQEAMPPQLEALLDGAGEGLGRVTCVVVDVGMSWALDGVKWRGLPAAALWAASAAVLAVLVGAEKLIRDGVIDDDGAPIKLENNSFHLAASTTPMDATFLAWKNMIGGRDAECMVFHYLTSTTWAAAAKTDVLLCNTFADLEPAIFTTQNSPAATILPIGPLRTWQRSTTKAPVGHFWRVHNEASLSFLDAQPHGSVVYVAFGSLTIMSPTQLEELALGLEASGRPFLWVVRPGLAGKLPTVFMHHGRGKVVEWAPQERVLAHPAIGCFLTHCGWNSTLESIRNGVPMLCWPYFTDQFANQTYISDIWRVGLRVARTDNEGMVTKERIMERLESILADNGIKERVERLKEIAEKSMSEEGQSLKNLNAFMESIRK
ncbi:UDP-glycosyltransferase 83A1-like [Phragmites australis]|uniref:UDP-glycosyltransferase 83A1-like n=1 Tax=Phragmites australis TaxID=29695 RepID=UPI002D766164|nr:UDP-glycosyltransferase 83A1-like [Phragmites australis]